MYPDIQIEYKTVIWKIQIPLIAGHMIRGIRGQY